MFIYALHPIIWTQEEVTRLREEFTKNHIPFCAEIVEGYLNDKALTMYVDEDTEYDAIRILEYCDFGWTTKFRELPKLISEA